MGRCSTTMLSSNVLERNVRMVIECSGERVREEVSYARKEERCKSTSSSMSPANLPPEEESQQALCS